MRSPGIGLAKGLWLTLKTMLPAASDGAVPARRSRPPAPRARGHRAEAGELHRLLQCARECPDWCIYIDAHKEMHDARRRAAVAASAKILDRFAIDYALCMYCGICVEVCPFDALFWCPEFEYAEYELDELTPREGAARGVDLHGAPAARASEAKCMAVPRAEVG